MADAAPDPAKHEGMCAFMLTKELQGFESLKEVV